MKQNLKYVKLNFEARQFENISQLEKRNQEFLQQETENIRFNLEYEANSWLKSQTLKK
jgi:hypothetical protein